MPSWILHLKWLEKINAIIFIFFSVEESDSFDAESGFEEESTDAGAASVVRFVSRFVDKVCTDAGVTEDHIKALHQMIPGILVIFFVFFFSHWINTTVGPF